MLTPRVAASFWLLAAAGCIAAAQRTQPQAGSVDARPMSSQAVSAGVSASQIVGDVANVVTTANNQTASQINSQIAGMRDWAIVAIIGLAFLLILCIVIVVLHGYTAGKRRWIAKRRQAIRAARGPPI